jgi:baculoviral IAP repeat-containing protein 6
MERLHSGGRKFVVLDFGAPILLTDVYIPACPDWVSITVDVWNRLERNQNDTDLVRLAVSSDINRRSIFLHDLQPPLVCRFLRLTITGRQGLSASSCKTSIGSFYGHSLILPNDLVVPAMQAEGIPILDREEIMVSVVGFRLLFLFLRPHLNPFYQK